VDGNTNGDFWGGNTSSATNYEYQPWWQVDLGSSQSIGSIQVWPRTDCCPEMTANFYVLVSDNPFTSTDLNTTLNQTGVSSYWVSGYTTSPSTVNINRTGRYVRIQRNDSQYLVLAEVRVIASTADVRWLVSDQLGTPRMIFDSTGSLANVSRHDYLPFGEDIYANTGLRTTTMGYTAAGYSAADAARQKFTGQERDAETGLDYMHVRYCSSAQGRFVSVDPLSGTIGHPQSWNGYAYSYNNPLRYSDPSGMRGMTTYPHVASNGEFFPAMGAVQQDLLEGIDDFQAIPTQKLRARPTILRFSIATSCSWRSRFSFLLFIKNRKIAGLALLWVPSQRLTSTIPGQSS
jgi:RHS repeat-associated protein